MPDEKQVVNLAVEPAPQIDRNADPTPAPIETPVESPVEPQASEPAPIPTVPPVNESVDEFGVPWKNRAMEWKRKSEDVIDNLPKLIDEKLSKINQPQQPQYTYEQLEAYKLQNATDANVVAWATTEQRKMQRAEDDKRLTQLLGQRDQQRDFELGRQQAYDYVKNEFPDAINPNHPMFNLVRQNMSDPILANRADGLRIAAKLAWADYSKSQTPALQKQVQQTKADLKQAQKASLTEGGGRRVTQVEPPQQQALDRLKKTGSKEDAQAALGAVLKSRGIIVE